MLHKKKCPDCGTLNQLTAVTCHRADCGATLRQSSVVVVQAAEIPEAVESSPSGDTHCDDDTFPCDVADGPAAFATTDDKSPGQYELVFGSGRRIPVGHGQLLGRNSSRVLADILRETGRHPGVSRSHAWVGLLNGQLAILDLGSTNGTTAGGETLRGLEARVIDHSELPLVIGLGTCLKFTLATEKTDYE